MDEKGFLLSPGDQTSCGGYILRHNNVLSVDNREFACEGNEYICGRDGLRYKIKGGIPDNAEITIEGELYRNRFQTFWDDDLSIDGRKVTPPSLRMSQSNSGLYVKTCDYLRDNSNIRCGTYLGKAGEIISARGPKKNIRDNHRIFSSSDLIYTHHLRMGDNLSTIDKLFKRAKMLPESPKVNLLPETNMIIHFAGTAHSRGTCKCHCRFIPRMNVTYQFDKYADYKKQQQIPEINHKSTSFTPLLESRCSVAPGFCILPAQTSPEKYENTLFVSPPDGTRKLYRQLNPEITKKAGSILIVVDPEKQIPEQIEALQKARDRIDTALAPLSTEEAKTLYENRTAVDIFSSQIYGNALGKSGDILGYISSAGEEYYKEINKILHDIEQLYRNTYNHNHGVISGEEFFGQRKRLFDKLNTVLNRFSKAQLNLKEYQSIKKALGLSTGSIMHDWNQTGVKSIEGYATYIEHSAKLMKMMRKTGYVGIALDFGAYTNNVYEACASGRANACRKAAIVEYSKFGMKQGVSLVAGGMAGRTSQAACMWVLGLLTVETGGIGSAVCLVTGVGASIAAGKMVEEDAENLGEHWVGDIIYDKLFK